MRVSEADILFVPDLGGSGPDHWQTRWSAKLTTGRPIDVPDVHRPNCKAWTNAIANAIAHSERPIVLIAHSLGAIAAIHAAQIPAVSEAGIRAAFLVAPPSPRVLAGLAEVDPAFANVPSAPLSFPSLLVASQNDPFASMAESEGMALDWGAQIVDAGEAGRLNVESGHGPWPEGLMRLATFLARL